MCSRKGPFRVVSKDSGGDDLAAGFCGCCLNSVEHIEYPILPLPFRGHSPQQSEVPELLTDDLAGSILDDPAVKALQSASFVVTVFSISEPALLP